MPENLNEKAREIEQGLEKLKKPEKPSLINNDKISGERAFAEMIGGMLFGLITGWILDDIFNSRPLFLIIMIILGLAGSIYNIYKAFENQASDDKK